MNNVLIDTLRIILLRWKAKSPKFFRVVMNISMVCACVIALPGAMAMVNIPMPEWLAAIHNKTAAVAVIVAAVIAKLTVENPDDLNKKP